MQKEKKGGEQKDGEEEFDDEEERIGPISFVPSCPFDRSRQRQKTPCVLLDALSFTLLSLSFTFLSVSPHLGRGPSTVCDPRPTFSSSIQNHYTTIGTSIELAATFFDHGATFYFFFFFFFFFVVVFDLVLILVQIVVDDVVSFSSNNCVFLRFFLLYPSSFPSPIPSRLFSNYTRVPLLSVCVYLSSVHLPSPSYLANGTAQASP